MDGGRAVCHGVIEVIVELDEYCLEEFDKFESHKERDGYEVTIGKGLERIGGGTYVNMRIQLPNPVKNSLTLLIWPSLNIPYMYSLFSSHNMPYTVAIKHYTE